MLSGVRTKLKRQTRLQGRGAFITNLSFHHPVRVLSSNNALPKDEILQKPQYHLTDAGASEIGLSQTEGISSTSYPIWVLEEKLLEVTTSFPEFPNGLNMP